MSLEKSLRKCEDFEVHPPDDKDIYSFIMHIHTYIHPFLAVALFFFWVELAKLEFVPYSSVAVEQWI